MTLERGPGESAATDASISTIVVVDDQLAFAEALAIAVSLTTDLSVVGRAPDAASGFDLAEGENPDLTVCDYRLPGSETGVDCAVALRESGYTGAIIILTGYPAPQVHREAARIPAPAAAVLSKDQPIQAIVKAFRSAVNGEASAATAQVVEDVGLSAGELEVLEMINDGQSAAEIATSLFLSVHAVRSRIKSALKKLDSSSQVEAIAKATRRGILVPPG